MSLASYAIDEHSRSLDRTLHALYSTFPVALEDAGRFTRVFICELDHLTLPENLARLSLPNVRALVDVNTRVHRTSERALWCREVSLVCRLHQV